MDYKAHYDKLIARGLRTLIHGYREKHHIIPKCLGGTNKKDNLVWLTAEEHYVAHQLLVKIHPGNSKLVYAAKMMTIGTNKHSRNNKLYGWLRQQFAESISKELKGRPSSQTVEVREKASRKAAIKNTGKKRTEEQKAQMSKNHGGGVQKGYKQSEEHRANCRKPKSAEARKNMTGRIVTEETKQKQSIIAQARGNNGGPANWSEETHKKASESQKAAWVIRKAKNGK